MRILLAFVVASCGGNSPPRASTPPTTEPAGRHAEGATTCRDVGPLSCDVPPVEDLGVAACDQLRHCLEGRSASDETIRKVVDCEAAVLLTDAGNGSAAAVATSLDVDGPPTHAAYLFVRSPHGWCAVDQLLAPAWTHGGHCSARFEHSWQAPDAAPGRQLRTTSERICHMPLDQEELAAGESDVASSECRQARYRVADDQVTRISEDGTDEACR